MHAKRIYTRHSILPIINILYASTINIVKKISHKLKYISQKLYTNKTFSFEKFIKEIHVNIVAS